MSFDLTRSRACVASLTLLFLPSFLPSFLASIYLKSYRSCFQIGSVKPLNYNNWATAQPNSNATQPRHEAQGYIQEEQEHKPKAHHSDERSEPRSDFGQA
mgnify:CR=1 FL=1